VAAGQALAGPDAPFNACKFNDPEYNSLYNQAIAELDAGKRADLIHAMVKVDYDRGANIIPYFFPTIDASTQKVGGIKEFPTGFSPSGNDFANFWLA
jgi:peptide/nickel transport system substrate-binding protein